LGKVFVEEALLKTGLGRVEMVGVIAYLIRTKRASGQADAIQRIEAGEFDHLDIQEEMIKSLQTELPETVEETVQED
jgi:hypothetical protein